MSGIFSSPKTPPPPKPVEMPSTPVVDQLQVDRDQSDMLKRRRGRAATVLSTGGADAGVAPGSVATKSLLGM
jgi:hypothetical protein